MEIREVMSETVHVVDANGTVREAATLMREQDIGSVPISLDDRLVGMITDRDIVLRVVAEDLATDTPLREVMSPDIKYCFVDQTVEDVARNMADLGVRRLPVVDREKRLVGFVSLANFAAADAQASDELLQGTAQPH